MTDNNLQKYSNGAVKYGASEDVLIVSFMMHGTLGQVMWKTGYKVKDRVMIRAADNVATIVEK